MKDMEKPVNGGDEHSLRVENPRPIWYHNTHFAPCCGEGMEQQTNWLLQRQSEGKPQR